MRSGLDEQYGCFLFLISLSTLKFDARNGYRLEEEEEKKILGQVLWLEVAGPVRYQPVKWLLRERSGRERERERMLRVRREKEKS